MKVRGAKLEVYSQLAMMVQLLCESMAAFRIQWGNNCKSWDEFTKLKNYEHTRANPAKARGAKLEVYSPKGYGRSAAMW